MPDATDAASSAGVLAIDAAVLASTGSAGFGLTDAGFTPKPFARVLAEKLALARALLGDTLDLSSGSVFRKLLEVSALEDTRQWAVLAELYDSAFVISAKGEALSRLGAELGLTRPFERATGSIKIKLQGALPAGVTQIEIPNGARLATAGGHHVALTERVSLSAAAPERTVGVAAFYPGASHNLDPAQATQVIDRWNVLDPSAAAAHPFVAIEHTTPLTGGELQWSDARYRQLLLRAPRSLWTRDAIEVAVSLVPGVRHALVQDAFGGLDISQSIFGNFNFIERVFGSERDLGTPYYFTVLVAPTEAAIWEGPDGLRAAVESVIEDLRPVGIFPSLREGTTIGVGIAGELITSGVPLPTGNRATVNASAAGAALKERILKRVKLYVDGLKFGEPVRFSEVMWSIMNEPGVADVRNLRLVKYPPNFDHVDLTNPANLSLAQSLSCGENLSLLHDQIAQLVDDPAGIVII